MKVPRLYFDTCRILQGRGTRDLELQYEKLVNLINDFGGKTHGSQFNGLDIIVYFQLPKENLDLFRGEEKQ